MALTAEGGDSGNPQAGSGFIEKVLPARLNVRRQHPNTEARVADEINAGTLQNLMLITSLCGHLSKRREALSTSPCVPLALRRKFKR